MQTELFFPDIETGLARMPQHEAQIAAKQYRGFAFRAPAHQSQRLHCRAVMLRPGPIGDVERAVGIYARFRRDRRTMCAAQIRAQESGKIRRRSRAPIGRRGSPIQRAQFQAEAHIVLEQSLGLRQIASQQSQRIDHQRAVAIPVEEIVRLRIVGGQHRRGHHRPRLGRDDLPEARPQLDDADRGNAGQQHLGGMIPFPRDPFFQIVHARGL